MQAMEDVESITPEWCLELAERLRQATWRGAGATCQVLPSHLLLRIYKQAADLFKAEPTLLEVRRARCGGIQCVVWC